MCGHGVQNASPFPKHLLSSEIVFTRTSWKDLSGKLRCHSSCIFVNTNHTNRTVYTKWLFCDTISDFSLFCDLVKRKAQVPSELPPLPHTCFWYFLLHKYMAFSHFFWMWDRLVKKTLRFRYSQGQTYFGTLSDGRKSMMGGSSWVLSFEKTCFRIIV